MTENKYQANFLWPYEDESLECLLYNFANSGTESYQKAMYDEIKRRQDVLIEACRRVRSWCNGENKEILTKSECENILHEALIDFED